MKQIEKNAAWVADGLISAWRNAYIIACSVEPGTAGRPAKNPSSSRDSAKVSAEAFARLVKAAAGGKVYGMGPAGIRAALAKWDRVAAAEGLPTSTELLPGDAARDVDYPDRSWKDDDYSSDVAVSKVTDIARNKAAMAEAIKSDPAVADAAAEALFEAREAAVDPAFREKVAKGRERARETKTYTVIQWSAAMENARRWLKEVGDMTPLTNLSGDDLTIALEDVADCRLLLDNIARDAGLQSGWDDALEALTTEGGE